MFFAAADTSFRRCPVRESAPRRCERTFSEGNFLFSCLEMPCRSSLPMHRPVQLCASGFFPERKRPSSRICGTSFPSWVTHGENRLDGCDLADDESLDVGSGVPRRRWALVEVSSTEVRQVVWCHFQFQCVGFCCNDRGFLDKMPKTHWPR